MSLDHVTLPTRSFEATVDFFARVVELPVIDHPTDIPMRASWFDVGSGQAVHVVEIKELTETALEREFGRHVAFRFPLARWLRIKNQIEREHIEIVPPIRESNVSRFFVYDPNGYCFEFLVR
jgi:catechol 2,3-dioxygenase-like lactoylglutathione lyase family enzyme